MNATLRLTRFHDDQVWSLASKFLINKNDITKYLYILSELYRHERAREIVKCSSLEYNDYKKLNLEILQKIFGDKQKAVKILKDLQFYNLINKEVNPKTNKTYSTLTHDSTAYSLVRSTSIAVMNDVVVYTICNEIYTVKAEVRERKYISRNSVKTTLNGFNINFMTSISSKYVKHQSPLTNYEHFCSSYCKIDTTKLSDLNEQNQYAINEFNDQNYYSINCKTGRLGTSFTNLPKVALKALQHDSNEQLYELDVKTCLIYMLAKHVSNDSKLLEYLKANDLYDELRTSLNMSRNQFKKHFNKQLFTVKMTCNVMHQFFSKFPETYRVLTEYQQHYNYKQKANVMQSAEADVFNKIKTHLMNQRTWFLSRYDSITVQESDLDYVYSVMCHFIDQDMITIKPLN